MISKAVDGGGTMFTLANQCSIEDKCSLAHWRVFNNFRFHFHYQFIFLFSMPYHTLQIFPP
jgi:hypothetical protein